MSNPPDVFISWRYPISLALGQGAAVRLLWLHDMLPASALPAVIRSYADMILVPSVFHARAVPSVLLDKIQVLPNGLNEDYFINGQNQNHIFVYASSPDRGLLEVLTLWPLLSTVIRNNRPTSTPMLHVYYGLRSSVIRSQEQVLGVVEARKWEATIRRLLNQSGVIYYGSVDHMTLSTGLAAAGFLLYPTRYPETSCITVMRAMALGAIPITSAYTKSVLFNLTYGVDLGPHTVLTDASESVYQSWLRLHWGPAVISSALISDAVLHEKRKRMIAMARSNYSWKRSADMLVELVS